MAELVLRYTLYFLRLLYDLAKFGILDLEWRIPFDLVNVISCNLIHILGKRLGSLIHLDTLAGNYFYSLFSVSNSNNTLSTF